MITVKEAFETILSSSNSLLGESVHFSNSHGRVLYEDVISSSNIPPFNNSAMDGYAVLYEDTQNATTDSPVELKIINEVAAGSMTNDFLQRGSVIRIMTGAPIPQGANAVVPFEDTSEKDDRVYINRKFNKQDNIRFAGEDISTGMTVLHKGRRITSADIGLLASLNEEKISVTKMPRIAVISTGDEIVEPGGVISEGQIRNSNAYTLISEIKRFSGDPLYMGIVRDDKEEAAAVFKKALEYDIVITTGGVSMGRYDYVKEIMRDCGVTISFEAISMKPGKPMAFGAKGKTLFFGLPGNPVSTMVSFSLFVRPALLKMMGASDINLPVVSAILENPIKKKAGRTNYLRGYFTIKNGIMYVNTTGPQGSGILRSMSIANCLIELPSEIKEMKEGESVSIILIQHGELSHG